MEGLKQLYCEVFGSWPSAVTELQASGSHRRYFRLTGERTVIGVAGTCAEENRAFIALDRHFASKGIAVPEILGVSPDGMRYLQEDLGDTLLFDAIAPGRENGHYSDDEKALLCRVISTLPDIQFACRGFDWSVCYPDAAFDERMILFDLNYFKYCFLKATGLEFNEGLLQDDFERLKNDLLSDDCETFMYRDFQARNIMIRDGRPCFIDFQGGRRGPVQYDLASFLFNAGTHFSAAVRAELENVYIDALGEFEKVSRDEFMEHYRLITLVRLLQEFGAYGFRGLIEKKQLFIDCIPPAKRVLGELVAEPFEHYPYLTEILRKVAESA